MAPMYDPVVGQNPPYGASINYWLQAAADDSVSITILDGAGAMVRSLKGPAKAGINRVWWDLRYDRSKEARLRTSPLYAPDIKVGPEGMPAPGVSRVAMPAPPGRYTVTVTAAGQELSQPLTVLKDPNSGGSEAAIQAQMTLVRSVVEDLNAAVDMINALESVRGQLVTLKAAVASLPDSAVVRAAADSLDGKAIAAEELLFQMRVTGRGQDILRWPYRVAEQLGYLAESITSSDYEPTEPQRQVHAELRQELARARTAYDRVMGVDVAAFNDMLRARGLAGIVTPR
jgi:hypothetical protein